MKLVVSLITVDSVKHMLIAVNIVIFYASWAL